MCKHSFTVRESRRLSETKGPCVFPAKWEQHQAIAAFVEGQDVFVLLSTGFGKTVCFASLPGTLDRRKGETIAPIIVVVHL